MKTQGHFKSTLSQETHLKRPRRRNWTLDPWRTMTPLRRASWQMKSHRRAWLCGWSWRPRCLTKMRGPGSAAEWDPARNGPSERRLRWSWGPPWWSFLDSTSSWSLFPLCSWCSPWLHPPDTEPKNPNHDCDDVRRLCGITHRPRHKACIRMCYEMKMEWADVNMWIISLLLLQTLRL